MSHYWWVVIPGPAPMPGAAQWARSGNPKQTPSRPREKHSLLSTSQTHAGANTLRSCVRYIIYRLVFSGMRV